MTTNARENPSASQPNQSGGTGNPPENGTTKPSARRKAHDDAVEVFRTFKSNALSRFKTIAATDSLEDEYTADLLKHFGLRSDTERDPWIVLGEDQPAAYVVAFAVLDPDGTDARIPVPSEIGRSWALSYVQRRTGARDVDVELRGPFIHGIGGRHRAILLETIPAASLKRDRVLKAHWRALCRRMQVTWPDGCPTWNTRLRDRWLLYSHANYRLTVSQVGNTPAIVGGAWEPAALSTHALIAIRWIATVGMSGLLVTFAQWAVQPKPKDKVSITLEQEAIKTRDVLRGLRAEASAEHRELDAVQQELTRQTTLMETSAKALRQPTENHPETLIKGISRQAPRPASESITKPSRRS